MQMQFARRNLSELDKVAFVQKHRDLVEARARARRALSPGRPKSGEKHELKRAQDSRRPQSRDIMAEMVDMSRRAYVRGVTVIPLEASRAPSQSTGCWHPYPMPAARSPRQYCP